MISHNVVDFSQTVLAAKTVKTNNKKNIRFETVNYTLRTKLHELITPVLIQIPINFDILTASDIKMFRNLLALLKNVTIPKMIPLLYCGAQRLNEITIEDIIIALCKTVLVK